jgi:hypothetical protein
MLDVKITTVKLIQAFNIKDAYEDFNRFNRFYLTKGIKTVKGKLAYQISQGAAHPADGFTRRVSFRKS